MEAESEFYIQPELMVLVIAIAILLIALIILYYKYASLKKAKNTITDDWSGQESVQLTMAVEAPDIARLQPAVLNEPVSMNEPSLMDEIDTQNIPNETVSNQFTPDELEEHIFDLYRRFGIESERYPWLNENLRWQELVFCLLNEIGAPDIPLEVARSVTGTLNELGLLQIALLTDPASETENTSVIKTIMERKGYSEEQASRAVVSLYELASNFNAKYNGKVQKYLRLYGLRMLSELGDHFKFSRLSDSNVQNIFTLWLQNVSNMPIGFTTQPVQSYCAMHNVKYEDLLAVADCHDINIALLDDLIAEYMKGVNLGKETIM